MERVKASRCLVGHTGFVGSTLTQQLDFSHLFNSANIDGIDPKICFEVAVCAAAPGSMLEANRNPETDLEKLKDLMAHLDRLQAERFVLISTIAVLADFSDGPTESTCRYETELAYGRNRRALEEFCQRRFANSLVVRLPALFGQGLKKNFIFDLLNPVPSMLTEERLDELKSTLPPQLSATLAKLYSPGPMTGFVKLDRQALKVRPERSAIEKAVEASGHAAVYFHNPETTYQYYNMERLWQDITRAQNVGLRAIHLATEPLAAGHIHQRLLGRPMPESRARLHREDMHTQHAVVWGRQGPYLEDATTTLDQLAAFFESESVKG